MKIISEQPEGIGELVRLLNVVVYPEPLMYENSEEQLPHYKKKKKRKRRPPGI